MRLYSLHQPRLIRQIIADAAAILALVFAFVQAARVRAQILEYLQVGQGMIDQAGDIKDALRGFEDAVREVPFVGGMLGDTVAESLALPDQLAGVGQQLQQAVTDFAALAWAIVALVPLVCVLVVWLPWRMMFAARSVQLAKLASTEGGLDLLAQRALAQAPPAAVLRVHPRPALAVQHDAAVRDALAAIQLRTFGLRPPRRVQ